MLRTAYHISHILNPTLRTLESPGNFSCHWLIISDHHTHTFYHMCRSFKHGLHKQMQSGRYKWDMLFAVSKLAKSEPVWAAICNWNSDERRALIGPFWKSASDWRPPSVSCDNYGYRWPPFLFSTNVASLLLTPPAKTWDIGIGSLCTHTSCLLDVPRVALFELLSTRMIQLVQTVIMDDGYYVRYCVLLHVLLDLHKRG